MGGLGPWAEAEMRREEEKRIRRLLHEAYQAGFNASGEGFNGEYGCSTDANIKHFRKGKNATVKKLMAKL